jgi:hypothetical protein
VPVVLDPTFLMALTECEFSKGMTVMVEHDVGIGMTATVRADLDQLWKLQLQHNEFPFCIVEDTAAAGDSDLLEQALVTVKESMTSAQHNACWKDLQALILILPVGHPHMTRSGL